jgi:hypothetical protein
MTLDAKKNCDKKHHGKEHLHENHRGFEHPEQQPCSDKATRGDRVPKWRGRTHAQIAEKKEKAQAAEYRPLIDEFEAQKSVKHRYSPSLPSTSFHAARARRLHKAQRRLRREARNAPRGSSLAA